MNYQFIQIAAGFIASIVLSANVVFAQEGDIEYTRVFSSVDISQWEISGLVTPDLSDESLAFIFPYDEDAARAAVPDTVTLQINDPIDLSSCTSAYVRYDKTSNYPNEESWIITNIIIFARHEYNHSWVRVFENISDKAGWVHELELKFKVVVKTDNVYPSTLVLNDIRVEGACGS